jgi:hypothetical protein
MLRFVHANSHFSDTLLSWHFHERGFPVTSLLPPFYPTDLQRADGIHKLAERIINSHLCLWTPGKRPL